MEIGTREDRKTETNWRKNKKKVEKKRNRIGSDQKKANISKCKTKTGSYSWAYKHRHRCRTYMVKHTFYVRSETKLYCVLYCIFGSVVLTLASVSLPFIIFALFEDVDWKTLSKLFTLNTLSQYKCVIVGDVIVVVLMMGCCVYFFYCFFFFLFKQTYTPTDRPMKMRKRNKTPHQIRHDEDDERRKPE